MANWKYNLRTEGKTLRKLINKEGDTIEGFVMEEVKR